jgi:hypothetical protein
MRYGAIIAGLVASLAFAGVAAEASAQTRAPQVSVAEAAAARAAAQQTQRRGLRLNDSGRWGIDFSLSQPQGRDAQWGDVAAGAYYRVSPRLQVGASAGLSEPPVDPARPAQDSSRSQPRVRLESIFRF